MLCLYQSCEWSSDLQSQCTLLVLKSLMHITVCTHHQNNVYHTLFLTMLNNITAAIPKQATIGITMTKRSGRATQTAARWTAATVIASSYTGTYRFVRIEDNSSNGILVVTNRECVAQKVLPYNAFGHFPASFHKGSGRSSPSDPPHSTGTHDCILHYYSHKDWSLMCTYIHEFIQPDAW